ncbi:SLC13 family permease [Thiovibrio frasassiensis]|uniref:SLC13 family permease n=1 Tax=Thiovibrio frasassiensis TaxID=2984131 RepID=A0A9X4RKK5_9BACT|nr:SLC13 family permease [Thiovibrio frasassiensis]MDG4474729.1 SLC13 family permease [Thiovibrio frasassiensis]
MPDLAVPIFIITYLGVALGRIPGLMLDRTGIALLGAIAMIASGAVPLSEAMAAIDLPTIILLYALMVLSAQLRLGGFYTWVAGRTTTLLDRPRLFLLSSMLAAALLSALLANDIVCLAFTPVLCLVLLKKGFNPLPFLLGLAAASNIGSAATIIGNPQNMLIGQVGRLHFGRFLLWCGPPTLIALAGAYLILCRIYNGDFTASAFPQAVELTPDWPPFDRRQTSKGLIGILVLLGLFFTPIPRELSAITVAAILLCSRKIHSRRILELVDWQLLTLFCSLFIVLHPITSRNIPSLLMEAMAQQGLTLSNLLALTTLSTILSNLVSNVPAVMFLVHFLDPNVPQQWYVLALSSTFAGNLVIIGSIANLIVIEQARKFRIEISFQEHARTGIPITLFSLLIMALLIYLHRFFMLL